MKRFIIEFKINCWRKKKNPNFDEVRDQIWKRCDDLIRHQMLREKTQTWRQLMGLSAEKERKEHLSSSTHVNTLASIDNLVRREEKTAMNDITYHTKDSRDISSTSDSINLNDSILLSIIDCLKYSAFFFIIIIDESFIFDRSWASRSFLLKKFFFIITYLYFSTYFYSFCVNISQCFHDSSRRWNSNSSLSTATILTRRSQVCSKNFDWRVISNRSNYHHHSNEITDIIDNQNQISNHSSDIRRIFEIFIRVNSEQDDFSRSL